MKPLWTPWRMEHVLKQVPGPAGCLFEPPGLHSHMKEHLLLLRNENGICLLNRFPYTNGHLLVAPIRHAGCITELTPEENARLMDLVSESIKILRAHLKPDGFNVGLNLGSEAGAGIAGHVHFHIVPRWSGDHNFMTVLADVRTIPEHLETTYDRLLPDFKLLLRKYRTK